jgi:hypothetical protein
VSPRWQGRAQLPVLPGANHRIWLQHDEARHALARGNLPVAARLFEEIAAGKAGAGSLFQSMPKRAKRVSSQCPAAFS